MQSIILIIPYFGKWPIWFDAFLTSVAFNSTIHWLCTTDCEIPTNYPQNIKFLPTTLKSLNADINTVLDVKVPISPKKFCDLKPAYGHLFQDEIKTYDFWGFCDMDIIWGDVRAYMTPQLLQTYDIISSLEDMISGHFTLFKNTEKSLKYYRHTDDFKTIFSSEKHLRFDEVRFTEIVKDLKAKNAITVFWDKKELQYGIKSEVHQEYYLDRWIFENGHIYDILNNRKEHMYLHFINWKLKMRHNEVRFADNLSTFYISYSGIHLEPHPVFDIKLRTVFNFFNGYWVNDRRRIRKHKMKSLQKRIYKRLFSK